MAALNIKVPDIQGLQPAVDRRKISVPHVVDGRNFFFDMSGPRSGFGGEFLSYEQLPDPAFVQSIRIEDEIWIFAETCICRYEELLGLYRILYNHADTSDSPYRWTHGLVNNVHYLCHPTTGLIRFDTRDKFISPHVVDGLPSKPIACAESYGRLIVLGEDAVHYSAQDNGFDFSPALQTLAGLQSLSIIGGKGKLILPYEQGFLTYTDRGIMRSAFVNDLGLFRHRRIRSGEAQFELLNSFAAIKLDDDNNIFLTESGFWQTRGQTPTPWEPLFNDFLRKRLKTLDLNDGWSVRLEWDQTTKRVFLLLGDQSGASRYSESYVLHLPSQKWGIFSEQHYGIGPHRIDIGDDRGYYFGYVGLDRRVIRWTDITRLQSADPITAAYYHKPLVQRDSYRCCVTDVVTVTSTMTIAAKPQSVFTGRQSGLYDGQTNFPLKPVFSELNSNIQVGLFRWEEAQYNDELGEITELHIDSVESGTVIQVTEDWNSSADTEDWNAEDTHTLDRGFDVDEFVDYDVLIVGTLDGYETFDSVIPELANFVANTNFYVGGPIGLWHIIHLSADAPGQAFHLKSMQASGTLAGRL